MVNEQTNEQAKNDFEEESLKKANLIFELLNLNIDQNCKPTIIAHWMTAFGAAYLSLAETLFVKSLISKDELFPFFDYQVEEIYKLKQAIENGTIKKAR
jgi:hypothetical protein